MRFRRLATVAACTALLPVTGVVQGALPALADETVSTRVDDGDPIASAIAVSQLRFPAPDSASPSHIVLSRDDVFADSLAGSALLGTGPLLFTPTAQLDPDTRTELERLRAGQDRRVYVLGGPNAISTAVANEVASLGFDVLRLAGPDRIATSIAIAQEAFRLSGSRDVLLARAWGKDGSPGSGWVDSVAGGARAANNTLPVLLTPTEELRADVAQWMRDRGIQRTHVLGGPLALSPAVFDASPGARRHAANERTGTAAAIARGLWGATDSGPRAFTIINGSQDRGWAFGLAAAGLAADRDAPVLLTLDTVTPATRRMVATCGTPEVDLTIIGDGTLVSGAVREYLDDLDGEACGPDRTLTRRSDLRRFEGCPELVDWYRTNALERVTAYGLGGWYGWTDGPVMIADDRGDTGTAAPEAAADSSDGGSTSGQEVSGTNVQEVGVDEPDILKTDGDVLALVAQDGSVDLFDLTGLAPRATANLPAANEWGQTELLLTGDVLTTLTTTFNWAYFAEADVALYPGQPSPITTTVTRWNIALPDQPIQLSSFEMDGQYRSARMIDGVARIVIESGPQDLDFTYPKDDTEAAHQEALEHNRRVVKASTLENWLPTWGDAGSRGEGELLVQCTAVHEPPAWSGFDAITVVTLDTRTDTEPGAAATVVAQGQNVYASTDRLLVTTGRWGQAFEGEQIDSTVSTEIHAFDITNPDTIAYVGSGRVGGYVINQFAMSEYQGDIRVAATIQPPWREDGAGESSSFVSVLQEQGGGLTEVGRVGGLGKGERIQAVRFFGDLGVVVTFRQVDPLYLLDMSSSTAPVVTGELKDTGFSRYLHRVGEDLLMGVGVDADEEGRTTGAQVSLYDISDRSTPTRVSRYSVPDGWSPVGDDHRAFLYWPTTGDAFVPISSYGDQYREVAAVLRVDGTAPGMARRGDLSHDTLGDNPNPSQIRRTFIVGPNVYSVSWRGIARHDLSTLVTTSFTPIPGQDGTGGGGPIPVEGTTSEGTTGAPVA